TQMTASGTGFGVIGTGDGNAHLVPDILSRLVALRGRDPGAPAPLALGNLDTRRDYLSVEDAAEGLFAMLRRPHDAPVDVYNLCSGQEHRVADIAEKVAAAIPIPITIRHDPALARRFDRPSQLGDPSKSWRRLAWRATTPLDLVIAEMVAADPRFAPA
ncbi:MAG: GDP-mannose 4,6-dehydratase, partial [Elsteraceae bacterium]